MIFIIMDNSNYKELVLIKILIVQDGKLSSFGVALTFKTSNTCCVRANQSLDVLVSVLMVLLARGCLRRTVRSTTTIY